MPIVGDGDVVVLLLQDPHGQRLVDGVVLYQQDAQRHNRPSFQTRARRPWIDPCGEVARTIRPALRQAPGGAGADLEPGGEVEGAAEPRLALHPDSPLHDRDQL